MASQSGQKLGIGNINNAFINNTYSFSNITILFSDITNLWN